jgi:hypothetical protein
MRLLEADLERMRPSGRPLSWAIGGIPSVAGISLTPVLPPHYTDDPRVYNAPADPSRVIHDAVRMVGP